MEELLFDLWRITASMVSARNCVWVGNVESGNSVIYPIWRSFMGIGCGPMCKYYLSL